MKNGEACYNCSIVDLYDRSVIASVTDRQSSSLAIRPLKKALESQPQIKEELILHGDQGSQYTSKAFVEFCESSHVSQSMSKAGCPYDNAPMERYFNTLDTEMEAVSSEMEVTAGLIQKLVDENAARKLDQHDYLKKYDGYASRYAALESRMDSLEKERERKGIQYDLFSGFLAGLSEMEELPVDFNKKLFLRLADYATVYQDCRVVFTFRNRVEVSTKI